MSLTFSTFYNLCLVTINGSMALCLICYGVITFICALNLVALAYLQDYMSLVILVLCYTSLYNHIIKWSFFQLMNEGNIVFNIDR